MSLFPSNLGFGVSGVLATPLISSWHVQTLIKAAFYGGVRVFDVAPSYGAGEGEKRLGLAIRTLPRRDIFIATKAGVFSKGPLKKYRNFSELAIETSLVKSLARLGVDGVDGLCLHGPNVNELTPSLFKRLKALKHAGAFRFLGLAGRTEELNAGLDHECFDFVMAPVHPFLELEHKQRLVEFSKAGKPVLAIETCGNGPAPLKFSLHPKMLYSLAKWLKNLGQNDGKTYRICLEDGVKHALSQDSVQCALFTTSRPDHLKENLKMLSDKDIN